MAELLRRILGGAPPPSVWGPPIWDTLHKEMNNGTGTRLRTRKAAEALQAWLLERLATLPCAECRGHAMQYVCDHPPPYHSGPGMVRWMFNFHNAVTLRRQHTQPNVTTRVFTPEDYFNKYGLYP